MLDSDYFDLIDDKKFLGWPIHNEIGGFCIDNILTKLDPSEKKYRISYEDTHPNTEGHKVIASRLYEEYKKIYIKN